MSDLNSCPDLWIATTSQDVHSPVPTSKRAAATRSTSYADDDFDLDDSQMLHDKTTLVNRTTLLPSSPSCSVSVSESRSSSFENLDLPASRHLSLMSFLSDTSACYDSEDAAIRANEEHTSDFDSLFGGEHPSPDSER